MCPESLAPLANRRGIALITAIFAIVILALFGLLIARYTVTTQLSSAEDYLWAQSLYSAESVMRLNILKNDGGGGGNFLSDPEPPKPQVGQIKTDVIFPHTVFNIGEPSTIRVRGYHDIGVSRTVEAKYIL
jgi:hypothetical protein